MDRSKRQSVKLVFVTMSLLSLILFAFGCGGGGDAVPPAAQTTTTIQGTVTAPGGTVVFLQQKNRMFAFMDLLVPSAYAEIFGTGPVGGATVEVFEVDDNGEQVGDVIASATTDSDGAYTLDFPSDAADLGPNLVVRVTGAGGTPQMRALAVQEVTNIDPVSEYVFGKLTDNGTSLSDLSNEKVIELKEHVNKFKVLAGPNLQSTLDQLDSVAGPTFNQVLASPTAEPSDPAEAAGNYHGLDFGLGLSAKFSDGNLVSGGLSAFIGMTGGNGFEVMPGQDSEIIVNGQLNSHRARLSAEPDTDIPEYMVRTREDTRDIDITLGYARIQDGIRLDFPVTERLRQESDKGKISIKAPVFLFGANDEGYYSGPFGKTSLSYSLTPDGDTFDLTKGIMAQATTYGLKFFGPVGAGLSNESVNGNWGGVELGIGVDFTGVVVAFTSLYNLTLNNGMYNGTIGISDVIALPEGLDSAQILVDEGEFPEDGTYDVGPTGTFTLNGDVGAHGSVAANAMNFFLGDAFDATIDSEVVSADRSISLWAKIPDDSDDSTDPSGTSYNMFSLEVKFNLSKELRISVKYGMAHFNDEIYWVLRLFWLNLVKGLR